MVPLLGLVPVVLINLDDPILRCVIASYVFGCGITNAGEVPTGVVIDEVMALYVGVQLGEIFGLMLASSDGTCKCMTRHPIIPFDILSCLAAHHQLVYFTSGACPCYLVSLT
jgi:hypothetical protein